MAWIQEQLFGEMDGLNPYFTISKPPVVESMAVYHNGIRLVRVVMEPASGEAQYGIFQNVVKVGMPPASGSDLWTRYYNEASHTQFSPICIARQDTKTITEVVSGRLNKLFISGKFENISVVDFIAPNLLRINISRNDAVTITESVAAVRLALRQISTFESVTASEFSNLIFRRLLIGVDDFVTAGENIVVVRV